MRKDKKKLTVSKIASGLKHIISDVSNVRVSNIENSTNLQKDLGIDSFNAAEILVAVEQKYGIKVEPSEIFNLKTFSDVLKLTERYIKE